MTSQHPPFVRTRLSMMMFLEFFTWGCWGVTITGYASTLRFGESQIGWLGAVPAIGAIISPLFVGLIADRFFSAQRMLSVLHLLGGASLILAGFQNSFPLLMLFMLLNGLAFMPTIALVNAVAFRHIPDPDNFPRIAVLGTVGWIVAIVVSGVFLGGAEKSHFLYLGGVGSILLALYALTLPDTPPKGAGAGGDMFGLSALKLFKEPSFLIFVVCVFLLSIPACGYFFTLMVPMLQQRGYPAPVALTSLNQFAELIFMFSMPLFVAKFGLKRVILIGMTAWAVRYLFFTCPAFSAAFVGLILHGFCYSFFYVGAYMWVDRRAPAELKSSAQSLLAFLLLGVGYLLGAKGAGIMMGQFPADLTAMAAVDAETGDKVEDAKLPRWDDPEAATSAWRFLDLRGTVEGLLKKQEDEKETPKLDLAQQLDTDTEGKISLANIERFEGSSVTVDGLKYSKEDLASTFRMAHEKLGLEGNVALDRKQWLAVQANKWNRIWFWPSIFCFVILAIFAVAFRDEPAKGETTEEARELPDDKEPVSEPPMSEEEGEPEEADEG
ncbi:MAG: MFS transporter [Planctomycetes bacterium]|nr:MFS transporter [Planctomycetota bacterium]MBL7037422.1 MFS transporter [Pirellulaceae bacterium]